MGINTIPTFEFASSRSWLLGVFLSFFVWVPSAYGQKAKSESDQGKTASKASSRSKKVVLTTALLTVSSDTAGYEVTLDKQKLGETPLPGAWVIKPGRHSIVLKTPKGEFKTLTIEVAAGETKNLSWPPRVSSQSEVGDVSRFRWAPWTMSDVGAATAASGVVALTVGALFGLRSKDLAETASEMNIRRTYRRDFTRISDQAEEMSLAANISYGIGAVAVIGGLTLAIFGDGGLMAITGDDDEGAVIIGGEF